jgi:hypothetical protein
MDEAVHGAGILGRDVLVKVEVFNLTCEVTRKSRRIKMSDGIYAGLTSQNLLPGRLGGVSNWGHTAQTCHDNATTTHGEPLRQAFLWLSA